MMAMRRKRSHLGRAGTPLAVRPLKPEVVAVMFDIAETFYDEGELRVSGGCRYKSGIVALPRERI